MTAGIAALAIALPVAQRMWPETAAPAGPSTTDSADITDDSAMNTDFPQPDGVPTEELPPGLALEVSQTEEVTTTHTGSATVELGPRPLETEEATYQVECLSPGTLTPADPSVNVCDQISDGRGPRVSSGTQYGVLLDEGQDSITIDAGDDTRWRITTSYVISEVSDWKVNANGQTYGVPNRDGLPDLVLVLTTDNEAGWAYADDVTAVSGSSPPYERDSEPGPTSNRSTLIPVYESDGSTLIGNVDLEPDGAPRTLPLP